MWGWIKKLFRSLKRDKWTVIKTRLISFNGDEYLFVLRVLHHAQYQIDIYSCIRNQSKLTMIPLPENYPIYSKLTETPEYLDLLHRGNMHINRK